MLLLLHVKKLNKSNVVIHTIDELAAVYLPFKLLAESKCLLATHSLLQHGDVVSYLSALFTAEGSQ